MLTAHGAFDYSSKTHKSGSYGILSCFSLYPEKIGAYGDAGIITTNNKNKANYIKKYRNIVQIKVLP